MGSFKLGLSKLTMKLLLVTAATTAIALAAPYNPYAHYNLNPYSSYYSPYNTVSGGVPSAVYATYSSPYSTYKSQIAYASQVPAATNAQLKSSPSYKIQKPAPAPAPKSSSPSKTSVPFSDPARLDDYISPGPQYTGNYVGKQLDKVAVLPSATSALAYMESYFDKGDLCGASGIAYMKSILSGASGAEANAVAEAAYKAAWAKGARLVPGSACEASDIAFKGAYASGEGSILESARAFVDNWPGLKTGNPCAVSGKAYMDAIIEGKSVDAAGYLSGRAFIVAFGDLARSGKSIEDSACADAAKAFIESANPPDNASVESAKAFIDATLTTSASGYDPVCAHSALAYMDAFASGKSALTSNLIAAKAFFEEYAKGTSPGPDSPCVKATLGYAANSPTASKANKDAMLAFIEQAVNDGPEVFTDPVCGAATIAYLDSKIAGKTDKEAGADSAEAYIQAFAAAGGKRTEACKRSATAYIKTF